MVGGLFASIRRFAAVLSAGTAMIILSGAPALAAGFAIKEQSPSALGNAFAGATAEAADISYMFFNPAGLTRHEGHHALAGASYIAPRAEPKNMSGSTAAAFGGVPTGGGNGADDGALDAVVPVLYGMASLGEDLKFGLGLNAPFGLKTDYDSDWAGRYHAVRSELLTININPAFAYRMADWLSFGVGVQAQYADAKLTNAVDFGSIGAAAGIPGALPARQDGFSRVEGDDWGFGANVGVLFEPREGTRFGAAYRSGIDHDIEGNAHFRLDGAGIGAALAAATGRFVDTGASAELTTPDMASFGAYHEINDRWAVMGEVQWTNWSVFDQLVIRFDNPAQPASVTEEKWQDSWFGALGVTYRPAARWAVRAGVAYDESPIPEANRTPRIPGEDRQWVALGASYQVADYLGVDLSYTHIFVDDSDLDLKASQTGNTFRGDLSGEYENAIDIVTLQGRLRF